METKRIFPILTLAFFFFGLAISGIIGYSLGLKKVRFVTEISEIVPKEVYMRAGEMTKIEGDIIYLKSQVLGGKINPDTEEIETEILKVKVDPNTKINSLENPRLNEKTNPKFEDIKVGSLLYVFSPENIRNKKEFLATEITILK